MTRSVAPEVRRLYPQANISPEIKFYSRLPQIQLSSYASNATTIALFNSSELLQMLYYRTCHLQRSKGQIPVTI